MRLLRLLSVFSVGMICVVSFMPFSTTIYCTAISRVHFHAQLQQLLEADTHKQLGLERLTSDLTNNQAMISHIAGANDICVLNLDSKDLEAIASFNIIQKLYKPTKSVDKYSLTITQGLGLNKYDKIKGFPDEETAIGSMPKTMEKENFRKLVETQALEHAGNVMACQNSKILVITGHGNAGKVRIDTWLSTKVDGKDWKVHLDPNDPDHKPGVMVHPDFFQTVYNPARLDAIYCTCEWLADGERKDPGICDNRVLNPAITKNDKWLGWISWPATLKDEEKKEMITIIGTFKGGKPLLLTKAIVDKLKATLAKARAKSGSKKKKFDLIFMTVNKDQNYEVTRTETEPEGL